MKRVLISQNENNNGTDYLIVDGVLVNNEDKVVHYGRMFSKTDDWNELYNDNFLEVRQEDNQLLIKSFYKDKDVVGRSIYYMYLIDETDNTETILEYLDKDSQLINRTFERKLVQNTIEQIRNNKELKKKIIRYALIVVGVLSLIYLLTRTKQ